MSILIVDDTASQRLLLTSILKSAGYADLLMARSAQEAWDQLDIEKKRDAAVPAIDLILLDISMPEISGIEACTRIKSVPDLQDIPIIMVTASTEVEDLKAAFAAGAMDYITKPPNRAEMLARVRSALQLKHEMDARKARERELLDYLEQVDHVTSAAAAVEAGTFDPLSLNEVGQRADELGRLARVFQRMGREVAVREQRLKLQVQKLRIEIDEVKTARQVAEITESDYFQRLESKVDQLRLQQE